MKGPYRSWPCHTVTRFPKSTRVSGRTNICTSLHLAGEIASERLSAAADLPGTLGGRIDHEYTASDSKRTEGRCLSSSN